MTPDMDDEFGYAPAPSGLAQRYHRSWREFAIWCAAADQDPLPAAPWTVLSYLVDHPGRSTTVAGRVTAINSAHAAAGLPAPGRAESLRQALDEARAQRAARRRAAVDRMLPRIPVWGWPGGLAGRRNAALLVLAAHGLPHAEVARLTLGDITYGDNAIHLGSQPMLTVAATGDPYRCPAAALRAWLVVRPALQRYNGHMLVENALRARTLPGISADTVDPDQPLFLPVDRHGYTPTPYTERAGVPPTLPALSADSIAAIVTGHLAGHWPKYATQQHDSTRDAGMDPISEPESDDVGLGQDYYERGAAARRRDHHILAEIPDLLDDAITRMQALLDHTDAILHGAFAAATDPSQQPRGPVLRYPFDPRRDSFDGPK
ncbi:hypothetical protein AB0L82_35530 [Nocardia sp. NPDC052001]|uniref:hypothetical protein n=1 Tax=Nocardia sp. NPDC052001 TaxID=3154853 RepID=UPI00342FFB61